MGTFGSSGGRGGHVDEGFKISYIETISVFVGTDDNGTLAVAGISVIGPGESASFGNKDVGIGNTATVVIRPNLNEHIIGIGGSFGEYIDSISIETNLTTHGPYGGYGGDTRYLYTASPGEEIVGLFGRSGHLVDAIGVITKPF